MRKIAQTDNEYVHEVPVSISIYGHGDMDVEPSNKTVPIHFRIEFEARSWGIKGITLSLIDATVGIPVIVTHWGTDEDIEETKTIVVDLTKLRQNRIQTTDMITIGSMEIYLGDNFSVDYKNSSLEIIS